MQINTIYMAKYLDSLPSLTTNNQTIDRSPAQIFRNSCRQGSFSSPTTGHCFEFVQTNVTFLPKSYAFDFLLYCQKNPKCCPLLQVTEQGNYEAGILAPGSDLRTDLPKYNILEDGVVSQIVSDISEYWQDDFYAFLLGCSFSFEQMMLKQGIPVRHIELNRNVPMYITDIQTRPAGVFHGPLVVSMRPIPKNLVDKAIKITSLMPSVHGAPVHVGDPAAIGIFDVLRPDFGDSPIIHDGEVPLFWACGVTPMQTIITVKLPFAITHSPGHMFVTSKLNSEIKISN